GSHIVELWQQHIKDLSGDAAIEAIVDPEFLVTRHFGAEFEDIGVNDFHRSCANQKPKRTESAPKIWPRTNTSQIRSGFIYSSLLIVLLFLERMTSFHAASSV